MISVLAKLREVGVSISSGSKGVFEKLRFCNGLVWTPGLAGEIKLRFQLKFLRCSVKGTLYGHFLRMKRNSQRNVCAG